MAAAYIAAGVNHFWHPEMYERIMPPWLPAHRALVLLSGLFEIILGLLLLFPQARSLAAWGLIILLIAVFPANVQMAFNYADKNHPHLWLALVRLPLQFFLIWWAWQYTA
jgi:uncharacterized membrane protein